jgi:hypothetical protein
VGMYVERLPGRNAVEFVRPWKFCVVVCVLAQTHAYLACFSRRLAQIF